MHNKKDIQFAGKHDYDKESALRMASIKTLKTFSVGIFRLELKNNGKELKNGNVIVRVKGATNNTDAVFLEAEKIIGLLDSGSYAGKKMVVLK